ncbi:MAG: hypothetical protein R2837_11310 [Aliarcobacter sp.]
MSIDGLTNDEVKRLEKYYDSLDVLKNKKKILLVVVIFGINNLILSNHLLLKFFSESG